MGHFNNQLLVACCTPEFHMCSGWQHLSESLQLWPQSTPSRTSTIHRLTLSISLLFYFNFFQIPFQVQLLFKSFSMGLKRRIQTSFRELTDLAQYKYSKLKLQFLTSSFYRRYYVSKQSSLSILSTICPTKIFFILGIGK